MINKNLFLSISLERSSWRHRVPNPFEPISVWEDLFLWRLQIFDAITSNFSWSEPGTLATLHDRPWTCISLSRTARKQGLKEARQQNFFFNLKPCSRWLSCSPWSIGFTVIVKQPHGMCNGCPGCFPQTERTSVDVS